MGGERNDEIDPDDIGVNESMAASIQDVISRRPIGRAHV